MDAFRLELTKNEEKHVDDESDLWTLPDDIFENKQ